MLLTFLNIIRLFSMDPWQNFGRGISDDSELFGIGGGIFQVIASFGRIGAVLNLIIAFFIILFTYKKRGELKERVAFICGIICLICLLPTILNWIAGAIPNLFTPR